MMQQESEQLERMLAGLEAERDATLKESEELKKTWQRHSQCDVYRMRS